MPAHQPLRAILNNEEKAAYCVVQKAVGNLLCVYVEYFLVNFKLGILSTRLNWSPIQSGHRR
jgi:hypothetical protein